MTVENVTNNINIAEPDAHKIATSQITQKQMLDATS